MNIKDLLFTTVNEGLYEHVNHCWSFVRNACNWKEKNISDFILNILARQKLGGIISSLPPATKLGQGYIFTGVCDSVHRGFCLSTRWDTTPRPGRHPPGTRQAPPGPGSHPLEQSILGDTVNERVVFLLECNLVYIFVSEYSLRGTDTDGELIRDGNDYHIVKLHM